MVAEQIKCLCGSCEKVFNIASTRRFRTGDVGIGDILCVRIFPNLNMTTLNEQLKIFQGLNGTAVCVLGMNVWLTHSLPESKNKNNNSMILNIAVTEIRDISTNYLTMYEKLLVLGSENIQIKGQLSKHIICLHSIYL